MQSTYTGVPINTYYLAKWITISGSARQIQSGEAKNSSYSYITNAQVYDQYFQSLGKDATNICDSK